MGIELGDLSIALIRDGTNVEVDAAELFPRGKELPVGKLSLAFNCYLVRSPTSVTLIDCGIGAGKDRRLYPDYHMRPGGFLEELARAGVAPEEVDRVILTHLHPDHVGWATVLDSFGWVPTFPNAEYVMQEREYRRLSTRARHASDGWLVEAFLDSIQPVFEANQARLVNGSVEIARDVGLIDTPGHSPSHSIVRIESGSRTAFAIGDLLHHPLQLLDPGLSSAYDEDPRLAAETRRLWLGRIADAQAIVLPAHFPPQRLLAPGETSVGLGRGSRPRSRSPMGSAR